MFGAQTSYHVTAKTADNVIGRCEQTNYLTLSAQSCLLQSRPDALDASGVLGVDVTVSTHALVFLHQSVVHQTCRGTNSYFKEGYKLIY